MKNLMILKIIPKLIFGGQVFNSFLLIQQLISECMIYDLTKGMGGTLFILFRGQMGFSGFC